MELLIVHAHNDETVIFRRTDHIKDRTRWNCNGSFVVVSERKHHGRQINAVGHLTVEGSCDYTSPRIRRLQSALPIAATIKRALPSPRHEPLRLLGLALAVRHTLGMEDGGVRHDVTIFSSIRIEPMAAVGRQIHLTGKTEPSSIKEIEWLKFASSMSYVSRPKGS